LRLQNVAIHKKPSIGEINTYGINERELAQFKKIHQSKMDSEIVKRSNKL